MSEAVVTRIDRPALPRFRLRPGTLLLIAVLTILVVPPIIELVQGSISDTAPDGSVVALTLRNYANLLNTPELLSTTLNSVLFALGASAISVVFGGVLAWIVERTDAPLKGLAYLTTIISMGTPYILYVTAWLFLLERTGPFNDIYRQLTGSTGNLLNVYSLWGMILVEGFLWSPLVFLMLSSTFRAANAEMEEAARMSGASVLATVWRISIRLAWPGILAMAIFAFIRNLESFDVPVLIGMPGKVTLLTTDIYLSTTQVPPQLGHASAFSVVMLVIVAGLLSLYGRISRNAARCASVTDKGFRPRPFKLGRWRWIAADVILLNFATVLLLPLLALLWTSLLPFMRPMGWSGLHLLTLRHFTAVLHDPQYIGLGWATLLVAAGTATIAMALTLVAGRLSARRQPGGRLVDLLAGLPLVFPGVILGLAMMQVALRLPIPLYGTLWLIMVAFVIRYMPYGMRYVYSGVLQVHRELEEASSVAGATQASALRRVVAPLLSPALVSGWLFIFLICSKELAMTVLLAGPGSQVMAVAMFDMWTNGQGGELSALGLIWTAMMTIVATGLYVVARRQGAGAFAQ
jgi:iron(III) transport system permease protein